MLKIVYMESTIEYLLEVYGKEPNEHLSIIAKGIPKITKEGIKYLLVDEENI